MSVRNSAPLEIRNSPTQKTEAAGYERPFRRPRGFVNMAIEPSPVNHTSPWKQVQRASLETEGIDQAYLRKLRIQSFAHLCDLRVNRNVFKHRNIQMRPNTHHSSVGSLKS